MVAQSTLHRAAAAGPPLGRSIALGALAIVLMAAAVGVTGVLLPVLLLVAAGAVAAVMRSRRDVGTALILVSVLLFVWPSPARVAPLGAVGTSTVLAGLACWALWACGLIVGRPALEPRLQPARWATWWLLACAAVSYVLAHFRTLQLIESRAADRGLIVTVASAGLLLLAADGLRDLQRLTAVVRALVAGAAFAGVLGITTFVTGWSLTNAIRLPLVQVVGSDWSNERSGFARIMGAMEHPIEYSATLAAVLPLAIYVVCAHEPVEKRRWWLALLAIVVALPMTVSRTSALGIAVAVAALGPALPKQHRRKLLLAGCLVAVGVRVAVPGLLGTIKSLFLNAGLDPSVTSRSSDYTYVSRFIEQRPFFGRGGSTFLPDEYRFLDNQYLLSLVESGLLGTAALLSVWISGLCLARGARRRSEDADTRLLAQALFASVAVVMVTSATYDSLSFSAGRGVMFLVLGCTAALWRLTLDASTGGDTDGLSIVAQRTGANTRGLSLER